MIIKFSDPTKASEGQAEVTSILKSAQEIIQTLKPVGWIAILFFFYVYGIILKRNAVAQVGPLTFLLVPLLFIPAYYYIAYDPPWWVKILTWLIDIIYLFFVLTIFIAENEAIQNKRDNAAKVIRDKIIQKIDRESLPIYSLYLRPFISTEHLATQSQGRGISIGSGHLDLETILQQAFEPIAPMIALGKPGEMFGAGRIASPDVEWQANFTVLAEHAKLILLVPSDHEGTLWEITWLKENNYLSKCIWVMPEQIGETNIVRVGRIERSRTFESYSGDSSWNATIQAAQELNLTLPHYEKKGAFFVMDINGRVYASLPLAMSRTLFRVRKIRKDLRTLQSQMRKLQEETYTHSAH